MGLERLSKIIRSLVKKNYDSRQISVNDRKNDFNLQSTQQDNFIWFTNGKKSNQANERLRDRVNGTE